MDGWMDGWTSSGVIMPNRSVRATDVGISEPDSGVSMPDSAVCTPD